MEKNGSELVVGRKVVTVDKPASCLWDTLPGLEAGNYRITYVISPSALPPSIGEFDVTP